MSAGLQPGDFVDGVGGGGGGVGGGVHVIREFWLGLVCVCGCYNGNKM